MKYSFRAGPAVRSLLEQHPTAIRHVTLEGSLVAVSIASDAELQVVMDDLMVILGSITVDGDARAAALRLRNHISVLRGSISQDFYNSAQSLLDTDTSHADDNISHSLPSGSAATSLSSKQSRNDTKNANDESEVEHGTQEDAADDE